MRDNLIPSANGPIAHDETEAAPPPVGTYLHCDEELWEYLGPSMSSPRAWHVRRIEDGVCETFFPEVFREVINDRKRGLYRKYDVRRLHDPAGKHTNCTYFVLDLDHDRFAGPALKAYAEACKAEYPLLAADLKTEAKNILTGPETRESGVNPCKSSG